jgi:hypothetical protein
MTSIFDAVVNRYFVAAQREAAVTNDDDVAAQAAICGKSKSRDQAKADLTRWIRLYKVHRVKWSAPEEHDAGSFAEAVAAAAIAHFGKTSRSESAPKRFERLRDAIENTYRSDPTRVERSFRSLTSKLLWCRFPDETPIYDRFAVQAVTALGKIYKCIDETEQYKKGDEEEKYERKAKDWKRFTSAQRDCWWYRDFCHAHRLIFDACRPALEERLGDDAGMAYRMFDKLLWIMGNEDLDYSLMNYRRIEW